MQALFFSASERPSLGCGYSFRMRDIQEIRHQNLLFLVQECEEIIGRQRGAPAYLSTLTGVPASLISMILSKALHSDTGKRRLIGDDTATKLEKGMGKEPGWMDEDRSLARDWREAAMLDKLRRLSATQREAVERMLDAFHLEDDDSSGPTKEPPSPSLPVRPQP